MSLPSDLLHRSPEEASRRIALSFLEQAQAASERLDDLNDTEALHDFRVAIRRLRSALKAWRAELKGALGKRHRRALRALQVATGGGRDAEVALAWLATQTDGLHADHASGVDWMVDRLSNRHGASMAHVCEDVRAAFLAIAEDVRDAIEVLHVEVHLARPEAARPFGEALAAKLREHADELVEHLRAIRSIADEEEAHAARIVGKRLRYLAEPVRPFSPHAVSLVKHMKRLQDVLGDLNDCAVMRADLAHAREESDADHRSGLEEIERRVQARREDLHARLLAGWLEDGGRTLVSDTERLATHLEALVAPALEIERKYLLSGLPEVPEGARLVEIDQGWIPGERLHERLRRKSSEGQETFLRTVKLGEGIQRIEIEEETSKEIFTSLWALTDGRRVQKRRYQVPVGDRVWEIDEFLDRELFLAEVELDDPDAEVEIPAWLTPHLVREVTGQPEYVNLHLAR